MYQTHTVADLVSALSLGVSSVALIKLGLAFADADLAYFDPRPALRRAARAIHQAAVHAGHGLNRALALLLLLASEYRDLWTLAVLDARVSLAHLIDPTSAPTKGAL